MSQELVHSPWAAFGRGAGGMAAALLINVLLFSAALRLLGQPSGYLVPPARITVQVETGRPKPVSPDAPGLQTDALVPVFQDEQVPEVEAQPVRLPVQTADSEPERPASTKTTATKMEKQVRKKTPATVKPANEAAVPGSATHLTGWRGQATSPGAAIGSEAVASAGPGLAMGPFDMGQVDRAPRITARPSPAYPRSARRRGLEGWVKVRFLVDRQGLPGQARVLTSSPPGVFDDSVLEALPGWRFDPGQKAGQAVDTWVVTTVRFQLTD